MRLIVLISLCVSLLASSASGQAAPDVRTVYDQMMAAMLRFRTASFTIDVNERIYGKMYHNVHHVKLQAKPFKMYLKSEKPDSGAELLFIEGTNNNKALINPNAFPFINVNLSPTNSLLRKNHHYTILHMGFIYTHSILRYYETTEKERFFGKLKLREDPTGTKYILEIDNDGFGYINYKVSKGENVSDIANKFRVNDQMILELNRKISGFDDVDPGQVISIPNSFARKILLHIDKKTMLPLKQTIYDLKGLYSEVEFKSFRYNANFTDLDFSSDNEQYGF